MVIHLYLVFYELKAIRGSAQGTTDAVRGRIGYKGGLFLFEFEWVPGKDKSVCVGLANTEASLTTKGIFDNSHKSITFMNVMKTANLILS